MPSVNPVCNYGSCSAMCRLGLLGKGPWTKVDQGGSFSAYLPLVPGSTSSGALKQGCSSATTSQLFRYSDLVCVIFSSVLCTPFCLHYFPFRRMTSATSGGTSPCLSAREGCGMPFLAQPVYTYLCTGRCTGISVSNADIPDSVLQFVVQKVHPCV